MQLSTGIIAPNTTQAKVEEILRDRAEARGLEIIPDTIEINMARPGMKVAICEARRKGS
jgi:hypothetical protein